MGVLEEITTLLNEIDVDNMMAAMVYPHFKVRVGVIKDRPPRHPAFNFCLDMGREDIVRALQGRTFRVNKLLFVFPERWMSVCELTKFMDALHQHPDAEAGRIKEVTIITSSPQLLTNFPAQSLRVISFNDDEVLFP